MKLLKKLAILATALTLCLGVIAAFTACGGGNNSSSSSVSSNSSTVSSSSVESSVEASSEESSEDAPATAYTFVVFNSDGTPAENINVQLCVLGNSAACFMPMLTDANGVVEYVPTGFPGEGEYEIHLFDSTMVTALEFTGPVSTPTIFGTITLTLK